LCKSLVKTDCHRLKIIYGKQENPVLARAPLWSRAHPDKQTHVDSVVENYGISPLGGVTSAIYMGKSRYKQHCATIWLWQNNSSLEIAELTTRRVQTRLELDCVSACTSYQYACMCLRAWYMDTYVYMFIHMFVLAYVHAWTWLCNNREITSNILYLTVRRFWHEISLHMLHIIKGTYICVLQYT
jgi:hypothetical protein